MEVSAIIPEILLPANYVTILSLVFRTDRIEILAESRQVAPQCSSCGTAAQRVQSRYERQLDDLPWQGLAVRLVLRLRRFFCDQEDCPRRIFAEAIPEVAPPKARKTTRLTKVVNLIGFALGGRPGARVMSGLGLEVSRDTLLREVRRAPMLESSTPRVLGVDDWSIRRGQTYGTMIVDLEKRRRVDLLPDRKAETLASWLAARPGVEVVSRDRSAVYAEAIRKGAPQALQIADKWHLYKNAGDALECVIAGQRKTLSEVTRQLTQRLSETCEIPCNKPAEPVLSRAEQKKSRCRENRLERYQRVIELYRAGRPKLAIAREIGLDVQTVRKFLRTDSFPERAQRRRWSSVDPYLDHLRRRWSEWCRNATTLWREIRERGYRGAAINVRRCVKSWREADGRGRWKKDAPPGSKPPKSIAVPSPRRAKWILIRDLEKLDAEERLIREELLAASPIISRAANLVLDFGDMIRTRKSEHMENWIATAKSSGIDAIKSFAAGIEADRAAVEAAMKFEWSNGQLEGQINRLKTIKRSMFGRANFDLLRKRVLAA